MMMRRILMILVLLSVGVSAIAQAEPPKQPPTSWNVRGEEMPIRPMADLQEAGLEVQDLPLDRNAAWVYLEAINAFVDLPPALQEAFDHALSHEWPAGQTELTTYMQEPGNRKALELTRKAAGMKDCQMPYFGDRRDSVLSILLPSLSTMRFLAKLSVVEGRRLEAEGNYDAALEQYLATMRMGNHAGHGATLIEGLVGNAIWSVGNRGLRDAVLRRSLNKKQLEHALQNLSAQEGKLPRAQRGIEQEQHFGRTVVEEICANPTALFRNLSLVSSSAGAKTNVHPVDGWGRLEKRVGLLLLPDRAITRHMNTYYERVLDHAKRGPIEARNSPLDEEAAIGDIPDWNILATILLPSLTRAAELSWRLDMDYAISRTTIAIRLYMVHHDGEPPASLQHLSTYVDEDALMDPCSNTYLRYEKTETGWILYSVNLDGIDNDGKFDDRGWDDFDYGVRFPAQTPEPFVPPTPTEH
jgi:hypothetical protein